MLARYRLEITVLGIAAAVIGLVGVAMNRYSFDVWAGIVLAPVLVVTMWYAIRRILGPDHQTLVAVLTAGYVVKLIGSCARYYVVFDAYGKNADAERYFDAGNLLAAAVRDGRSSFFSLLPFARDARFIEHLSGLVMVFLGPSRLGAFFVFSTLAYLGVVCCVRAAAMTIPGFASARYATMCALAPSLAFWPSSMGKEAWISLCIGTFSLGFAKILTGQGRSGGMVLAVLSALGVGAVRPHLAAIFVGAATVGFVFGVMVPGGDGVTRRRGSMIGFALVALVGLGLTGSAAVRYLDTGGSASNEGLFGGISSILQRTTEQTGQGGSAFEPVNIDSPTRWPYAAVRTLTRPLPIEVHNLATLLPSLETTLFLLLLVVSWQRTTNVLHVLRRSPYLMYVLVGTFLFGLAFSAVGNLGILVRQRSLVVPFVLVVLCLPRRGELERAETESRRQAERESATLRS